jgi:hypothetical protein
MLKGRKNGCEEFLDVPASERLSAIGCRYPEGKLLGYLQVNYCHCEIISASYP